MSDFITIATPTDADLATKKIVRMPSGRILKEPYPRSYLYRYERREVVDIHQLSCEIGSLARRPDAFVVRGEPIHSGSKPRRRLYKTCQKTGDKPTLREVDHHWLCLDIDGLEMKTVGRPGEEVVVEVIQSLPEIFHSTVCHYHYTSSHGLEPDRVHLHLWFWSDRKVCGRSVRQYLKAYAEHVDVSPFSPVQPHYTADPIFVGLDDPVPVRSGMIYGRNEAVTLPAMVVDLATEREKVEELRAKAVVRAKMARMRNDQADDCEKRRYAAAALRSACEAIESAGEGDRHRTIFSEAASIGELYQYLDESDALRQLEASALAVLAGEGRRAEVLRTVPDAFARGKATPRNLVLRASRFEPKARGRPSAEVDAIGVVAMRMGVSRDKIQAVCDQYGAGFASTDSSMIEDFRELIEMDLKRLEDTQ